MDRLSPKHRSWLMSRVKGRNTLPELVVRKLVHGLGFRFRLHGKSLPGKPDLVFASRKKAVFVHGCFWHRHAGCKYATSPKTRRKYWNEKFVANVERDRRTVGKLRRAGWSVMTVWQCETKRPATLEKRLDRFLRRERGNVEK
jgi:DNA mismatch endonuclease (patch repair protein)